MKVCLKPRFQLHVEGDHRTICDALRKAGLTDVYEQWITDSDPLFEDDHDAGFIGSISLRKMSELCDLVAALHGKVTQLAIYASAFSNDKSHGFSLYFGTEDGPHTTNAVWECDRGIIGAKYDEVLKVVGEKLAELETLDEGRSHDTHSHPQTDSAGQER